MSDEFGPWIAHDGSGCPVPLGTIVHVEVENVTGLIKEVIQPVARAGSAVSAWRWSDFGNGTAWRVLRYRVKKPRGLTILEEIAKGVREPVGA